MNNLFSLRQPPLPKEFFESVFCFVFVLFYGSTSLFCQTPAIEAAHKTIEIAKRDSLNTPQYAVALRDMWLAYRDYLIVEKEGTPDTLSVLLVDNNAAYKPRMDSLVKAATMLKGRDLSEFWQKIEEKEKVLYQDMVQSLVQLKEFTYSQMTNYAKTLPYLGLLEVLYTKLADKEGYFDNIYALEDVYSGIGQYDKAHIVVEEARTMLKQELIRYEHLSEAEKAQAGNKWLRKGKRHCINLTTSLCARFRTEGHLDSAILNGKKAVALMKAYLKDSVYTPFSYNNPHFELARVYNENNQPDSAIIIANEGLDLYTNAAPETSALQTALNNAYRLKGDLVNVKKIALKRYESSEDKINGLSSLASFYIETGQFGEAFKWLNLYADSSLSKYGKGSFLGDVAPNFYKSKYYSAIGEYDKAEKHIHQSIATLTNLGFNAATIEMAKYELAEIYEQLGQYEKALRIRRDIHQTAMTSTFPNSRERVLSWAGLGFNYLNLGQLDSAQFCYEKCYGIMKTAGNSKKGDVITILTHLGSIKELLHDYATAEKWYREAQVHVDSLELFDKAYISMWVSNLVQILRKRGQYTEAFEKNNKALALLRGVEKTDYNSKAQLNQALLHEELQQNAAAADSLNGLLQHTQNRIAKEFAYLPEPDKIAYLTKLDKDLFGTMQAAYARLYTKGETAKAGALFYNTVLLQKELSLVDTRSLKRKASILNDSLLLAQLFKINALEERIKSDKPIPITERQRLSEEIAQTKADLEQTYPQLFEKDWTKINWQSVQKQLKTNEIAIEFADVLNNDDDTTKLRHYYALVITPNSPHPTVIPLFEEQALIHVLDATVVKEHFERKGLPDTLLVNDAKTVAKRYNATNGQKLTNLIWQPLENAGLLRGVTKVHFAPSGLLNRIAFAALPIVRDTLTRLMAVYQLRQYNTTRAIVETTTRHDTSAKDLVLFGDIQYGFCEGDSSKIAEVEAVQDKNPLATRSALFLDSMSICWAQLAHSKTEVERISRIQKAQQPNADFKAWTGYSAGEARFKSYGSYDKPSPSTLYITSHGFGNPSRYPESRYASAALHRAGLVMAGANWTTCCHTQRDPDAEDGILTAYEIAQLNLSNTDLVVLNGCQTGLGDIWGREGVFGLTRGFKLAGVNYIIASLWEVPDAEAADFMTAFYSIYLSGKSITEAFDQTRQTMQKKQSAYSWAAWVLIR